MKAKAGEVCFFSKKGSSITFKTIEESNFPYQDLSEFNLIEFEKKNEKKKYYRSFHERYSTC